MSILNFMNEMRTLSFSMQDNELIRSNRSLGYDNDCSDDERDDSFYDEKSAQFYAWANPIIKKVRELATVHDVKISVETSAEYGDIMVSIK